MEEIEIRECVAIDELDSCIRLQREVFRLPEAEVSPRRHFIVSHEAGGWTLGAFANERLVGFVHHLAAVRGDDEIFGYSHVMAVDPSYQNQGIGARLKWSQRARAMSEGRSFIKWTWDPLQARNAYFNLNRLGVTVSSYAENFYGTDYATDPTLTGAAPPGIDSDRLFADWQLNWRRVADLENGVLAFETVPVKEDGVIDIPANWTKLCREDPSEARRQQLRVRSEFQQAFASGCVAAAFERSTEKPRYLLYQKEALQNLGMV
jgi:predicted GNAT superfamily acetyltransferase